MYSEIIGLENDEFVGDLNNDLIINVQDIIIVINLILSDQYIINADLNFDGEINILDIVEIVNIILDDSLRINDKINPHNFNSFDESIIQNIKRLDKKC